MFERIRPYMARNTSPKPVPSKVCMIPFLVPVDRYRKSTIIKDLPLFLCGWFYSLSLTFMVSASLRVASSSGVALRTVFILGPRLSYVSGSK